MIGQIYTLRIKLSDFIETPLEEMVIDSINAANVHHTFKLQLWYGEGEITAKNLKKFLEKYESLLHYKTTIRVGSEANRAEFTWYNIIHKEDFNQEYPYRFQYKHEYEDKEFGVIRGLEQFKQTLKLVFVDFTTEKD